MIDRTESVILWRMAKTTGLLKKMTNLFNISSRQIDISKREIFNVFLVDSVYKIMEVVACSIIQITNN